jgi:hypothetical protein
MNSKAQLASNKTNVCQSKGNGDNCRERKQDKCNYTKRDEQGLRGKTGHFFTKNIDRPTRCDVRHRVEMAGHTSRVREQAVNRYQGRDPGENCEKRIERDAGGNQQDAVFGDAPVDAPKNILPSPRWDLRGGLCRPAATCLPVPAIAVRWARLSSPPPRKSNCDQQNAQSDRP